MSQRYGLTKPVWQNTNFVVFDELFKSVSVNGAGKYAVSLRVNFGSLKVNFSTSEVLEVFLRALSLTSISNLVESPPEGWRRPQTPRRIGSGATETRWLEHAISGHASKVRFR